jgi:ribosome-associated protein
LESKALSVFISDKIDDMKGRDIQVIDVSNKASFTDYMVICSGNSNRHVKSIAQNLITESRANGIEPLGLEGNDVGEWSLVDLGDVVVHIMTDDTRDTFQLEKLWAEE